MEKTTGSGSDAPQRWTGRSFFGALRRTLSSDHLGWRLFVAAICVFCLAVFLHFREVRIEVLELNTTADRYIVAQIDFDFPDYETTIVLKQQAMQEIGQVYRLDPKEIRKMRFDLENSLVHSRDWRKEAPNSSFEEMDRAIDELEIYLLNARFSDARTIQIAKEFSFPSHAYYEWIPEGKQTSHLPDEFWKAVSDKISKSDSFRPETVPYVVKVFQAHSWEMQNDDSLMKILRSEVSKTVGEKYTRVQAGERVIEPGERVTSRHLTMMQAMKQAISESRKLWDPVTLISSLLLSFIIVFMSALYFRMTQPSFIRSLQQVSLFVCIILLTLAFAKLAEYALLKSDSSFIERIRYPIVVPFATILICILLSPRTALYASAFLSIILAVSLAVDHGRFLILNLIASIAVIIFTKDLRKRKEVFSIFAKALFISIPVFYVFTLSEGRLWNTTFLIDSLAAVCFMILSAVLVVGLLPVLESLFSVLTDMTLMEYMDPNNVLLQRLAMEVPGTYQHCLVLANLAEACAQAIGANALLCRVATLYHDIGKMLNPQFYTENQQALVNIHQLLTPLESAQVIISHVIDGEMLARKHRLPQSFIDIIRQHHGTTLVYYFYRKQLELKGGKKEEVDESAFRYPGPKPQTKEAAIVMICDSVEAASRSLEEASEQSIHELVERIVSEKADEQQFDESNLTFEELGRVKRTLVKSMFLIHHVRVKYPKKEKQV